MVTGRGGGRGGLGHTRGSWELSSGLSPGMNTYKFNFSKESHHFSFEKNLKDVSVSKSFHNVVSGKMSKSTYGEII